jgi:hypothetical protein
MLAVVGFGIFMPRTLVEAGTLILDRVIYGKEPNIHNQNDPHWVSRNLSLAISIDTQPRLRHIRCDQHLGLVDGGVKRSVMTLPPCHVAYMWMCKHQAPSSSLSIHNSEKGDESYEVTGCLDFFSVDKIHSVL